MRRKQREQCVVPAVDRRGNLAQWRCKQGSLPDAHITVVGQRDSLRAADDVWYNPHVAVRMRLNGFMVRQVHDRTAFWKSTVLLYIFPRCRPIAVTKERWNWYQMRISKRPI